MRNAYEVRNANIASQEHVIPLTPPPCYRQWQVVIVVIVIIIIDVIIITIIASIATFCPTTDVTMVKSEKIGTSLWAGASP